MSNEKKLSIKERAKALQMGNSPTKEAQNTTKNIKKSTLLEYFEYSKSLEFECNSVTHIDNDAHDILSRLKKKEGIKIGSLVSALIKDFFEANERELKELLKPNK